MEGAWPISTVPKSCSKQVRQSAIDFDHPHLFLACSDWLKARPLSFMRVSYDTQADPRNKGCRSSLFTYYTCELMRTKNICVKRKCF